MSSSHRRPSDGLAQPNFEVEGFTRTQRDSAINGGRAQGRMPPPPVPIDPALDSFNVNLSSGIGDHLLQSGPPFQRRLRYSGTPASIGAFLQEVQLPAMRQPDLDPYPMSRFQHDAGPWTSQRIGDDVIQHSQAPRYQSSYGQNYLPVSMPNQYRESPRSEHGSSTMGRNPVDSGYGSRSIATKSVRSADAIDHSPSCQSLTGEMHDMRVYPDDQFPPHMSGEILPFTSEVSYAYSLPSAEPTEVPAPPLTCPFPECVNYVPKNSSEYRKHQLRHTKPFLCEEPGCTRKEGFSTNNDLERHKKSIHKIAPKKSSDRSFRCAAPNCPKRDKIWPRLDNFRQHCSRMHADDDLDELVRNSLLDTGVTLGSRAPEDVPRGAEVHNNMDHVESSALEYTTLSALNIKATGIESRVAFSQPDSHSSSLAQDVSLQVKATVHPVSGSNELNQSPGGAKSWLRNRSEGSQEEVPPVAATETLHQTGGLKDSVSRHDFLDEESRRSKMGSMLHDLTINLSNNPRSQINSKTKALALMKFEEASQALATQVHSGSHTASLEELQSLIKNGFLSMLNSCATRKRSSAEASLSEPSGSKRKLVACEFCPKKLHRECDLKKHQKRHTRPYGCTFKACIKAFGSKNDWKRHENTQHYQVEAWRCHEVSANRIKQCAKVFYRRELFQSHLRDGHKIEDDDYIREQLKRHQIGRNGQTGFWCGFCQKIVKLKKQGLEAWDERFNHIDDNHFKKGCRIDQWYELDRDIPKGLLRNEHILDSGFPSVDPDSDESGDENVLSNSSEETQIDSSHTAPPSPYSAPTRKERNSGGRRGEEATAWFCCKCQHGPLNSTFDETCTNCVHRACSYCAAETYPDLDHSD